MSENSDGRTSRKENIPRHKSNVNSQENIDSLKYVSTKCRQFFYLSDNPLILLPKLLYVFQNSLNKAN